MRPLLAILALLLLVVLGIALWGSRANSSAALALIAKHGAASADEATSEVGRGATASASKRRLIETATDASAPRKVTAQADGKSAPSTRRSGAVLVWMRDRDGLPIPASISSVQLVSEFGGELKAEPQDDGSFAHAGLAFGRWWVEARADAFEDATRAGAIDVAAPVLELTIALRPRPSVRVLVQDREGGALSEAQRLLLSAVATSAHPGRFLASQPGAAFGVGICGRSEGKTQQATEPRSLGLLVATCDRPAWVHVVLGTHVLASERWASGASEIVITLDSFVLDSAYAALRFRLVDARTGAPIDTSATLLHLPWGGAQMKAARQGVVEHTRVQPGPARLEFLITGYAGPARELLLEPGVRLDLGDIVLQPSAESRVHIDCELPASLEPGADFAQIRVEWRSTSGVDVALNTTSSRVFPRGVPLVVALPAGTWRFTCSTVGGMRPLRSREFVVTPGPSDVHVSTRLESLARLTLLPASTPCRVTLIDPLAGVGLERHVELNAVPSVLTLPQGRWELSVRAEGHGERRLRIELPLGGASVELE